MTSEEQKQEELLEWYISEKCKDELKPCGLTYSELMWGLAEWKDQ